MQNTQVSSDILLVRALVRFVRDVCVQRREMSGMSLINTIAKPIP